MSTYDIHNLIPEIRPDDWDSEHHSVLKSAAYRPSERQLKTVLDLALSSPTTSLRKAAFRILCAAPKTRRVPQQKRALECLIANPQHQNGRELIQFLSLASDATLEPHRNGLVDILEQRNDQNTIDHVLLYATLTRHQKDDHISSRIKNLTKVRPEGAQHAQTKIIDWLNTEAIDPTRGCQWLEYIYRKLPLMQRIMLLNTLPDPPPKVLLPVLARLIKENIPLQDRTVLRLCDQLNTADVEPILIEKLNAPHQALVSQAAIIAARVGTRRCLAILNHVKTKRPDFDVNNYLTHAINKIELRHPDDDTDTPRIEGALSLAHTQGTEGGLSIAGASDGSLTLYERVEHHIQRHDNLPPTIQPLGLEQWQNLAPSPRAKQTHLMSKLLLTRQAALFMTAFILLFGTTGALAQIFNTMGVMQALAYKTTTMSALVGIHLTSAMGMALIMGDTYLQAKRLNTGLFALLELDTTTTGTEEEMMWTQNYHVLDSLGKLSHLNITKRNIPTTSGPHPVLLTNGNPVFLDHYVLKLSETGRIVTNPIWFIAVLLLNGSLFGLWVFMLLSMF